MSMTSLFSPQKATGRETRGHTPVFRPMLAGDPLNVTVLEASMTLGENIHDSCTLTVSSAERTTTDGIVDSPISFLYGSAPRTEVFCGYVTSVTAQQSTSGVLTWSMDIVGATKSLQSGSPRFWVNRTIPSAVETLSYASYLGYTGHTHTHIWSTLAQTDISDWQMAVALARRLGWSVFNRYGIVMLYDPLQLLKDQGSAATLISETYTIAKTTFDEERSLLEFDPSEEAETSSVQQGLKVAYFNNDQMQVATQKGDHFSYRFLTDFVIRSAEEAEIYVNSKYSDLSRWRQKAKARVMGNASLFPGLTVEILTTNPKHYTGKFNGRWLIRGVQHKMDRQQFQTNLILARPESKAQVFAGPYVSFWQSLSKSRPTLSLSQAMSLPTPVGTVTSGAASSPVWYSSWTNSSVRSVL